MISLQYLQHSVLGLSNFSVLQQCRFIQFCHEIYSTHFLTHRVHYFSEKKPENIFIKYDLVKKVLTEILKLLIVVDPNTKATILKEIFSFKLGSNVRTKLNDSLGSNKIGHMLRNTITIYSGSYCMAKYKKNLVRKLCEQESYYTLRSNYF